MTPALYMLFITVCIVLAVWNESNARKRKEQRREKAHDKVIELTRQGMEASVCPHCGGTGKVGLIDRDCKRCGGIGYQYSSSPAKKNT